MSKELRIGLAIAGALIVLALGMNGVFIQLYHTTFGQPAHRENTSRCVGLPPGNDVGCNGVDGDCDGAIDEDYEPYVTSCGRGGCANTGKMVCSNGVMVDTCVPGIPAKIDAIGDAIDNDCDGTIDEDPSWIPQHRWTQFNGGCNSDGRPFLVGGPTFEASASEHAQFAKQLASCALINELCPSAQAPLCVIFLGDDTCKVKSGPCMKHFPEDF